MAKMIQMKRNRFGQFVKGRTSNPPARKKHHAKSKHRKNYYGAGAVVPFAANPPKHRKHRRNPPQQIAGIPIPNLEDTIMLSVGVAGGMAGPPIIRGALTSMLPAGTLPPAVGPATTSQTIAGVGVSVASYGLPLGIGYMVGGRTGLKYVAAGEMAGFFVQMLQKAASSIQSALPQSQAAGYTRVSNLNGYVKGPARQLGALPVPMHTHHQAARSFSRQTRFLSPRR